MTQKKLFFILSFLLILSSLSAQVTIGSTEKPVLGALLDLKEENIAGSNASKGLLMPRVFLNNENELATSLDVDATAGSLNANEHAGLIVYNVNNCITQGEGLYVWDGSIWQFAGLNEPRRLEFFGGNINTGTFGNGSAIIRTGAECIANTETIIGATQNIEGTLVTNNYASITKLIVASDGTIHGIGEISMNNTANSQGSRMAFYWNENMSSPMYFIPTTGSLSSFISNLSSLTVHDIIEYDGNIYACGNENTSSGKKGFIWSTPLTSTTPTASITSTQTYSQDNTSFAILNDQLMMLYQIDYSNNRVRNITTDSDATPSRSSLLMPSDILLSNGTGLYTAGFLGSGSGNWSNAWITLYNVTANTKEDILRNDSSSTGKARVRGTVNSDGTIYLVGGAYSSSSADPSQPLSFIWNNDTKILNRDYITNYTSAPGWDSGDKVGAFEEIVIESNGTIHLTMETNWTGQFFYWNSATNKVVNFEEIGENGYGIIGTGINPKSFVVVYR